MIQYDRMEIAIAIAACEIAFWALLFGGMAARYWWRRRRLSTVLLVAIPVADALLLALTAIDLARGARGGMVRTASPRSTSASASSSGRW